MLCRLLLRDVPFLDDVLVRAHRIDDIPDALAYLSVVGFVPTCAYGMVAGYRAPLVVALMHVGGGRPIDAVDAPRPLDALLAGELDACGHTLIVDQGFRRVRRLGDGVAQTVDNPRAVIVLDGLRTMATGTVNNVEGTSVGNLDTSLV